jgi:N-acyl-D-aspartate/D-glutamate deacylase
MLDLIIKNGQVFDGLAAPRVGVDIGIQDGRIVVMTPALSAPAQTVCDASRLWVTPGFIDIHTHYDLELEIAPGLAESVRHGVTSVVIGNCSLSLAIGTPQTLADTFQRVETLSPVLIQKWLQTSMEKRRSPKEYLQHLQDLPLGPNVAPMLGHSALRSDVMGLEQSLTKLATESDLEAMRSIAELALDSGFIGISIDMFPWHMMSGEWHGRTIPSQHANLREYAMLAKICRERDAVFQVTPNLQRLMSMVEIAWMGLGLWRRPLRMTVLSALDAVHHRQLWRVFAPVLFGLNRLLGCNIRFQTLTEPFTIYSDGPITPLFEEFPTGVQLNDCNSRSLRSSLWRSPDFRVQFYQDWTNNRRKSFHRQLSLMEIVDCPDKALVGLNFVAAAQHLKQEPVAAFMHLLEEHDTDLRWVATGANDRLQPRLALMKHPHIFPGFTDAGAHVQHLGYYDGALSLLKQAVNTGFMSPEQAISRVTGEPASWFGLDTGVIKVGAKADLVLLRPEALNQPISPQIQICDPILNGDSRMVKRGSESIVEAVYINGKVVVSRGDVSQSLGCEPLGTVLTSIRSSQRNS